MCAPRLVLPPEPFRPPPGPMPRPRNHGKHGLILAACEFGRPAAVPNEVFVQTIFTPSSRVPKERNHALPRVGRMNIFCFFWRATSQPRDRLGHVPGPKHELLASGSVSSRRIHPPGTSRCAGPADSGSSEKQSWYDTCLITDICSYLWALLHLTASTPTQICSHPARIAS